MNQKKQRFLDAVRRAADSLGAPTPKVNFWEDFCPYDKGNELAHIHLDTKVICISEYRLNQMTYDDIDETATHEVTHLIDASHDPSFRKAHADVKTASWKPDGLVFSGGANPQKDCKPPKPIKPHKKYCNYHLCRKKRKLEQCLYCNGFYCSEHIRPKQPSMMNFDSTSAEDTINRLDSGGHPCPQYAEVLMRRKGIETEKYGQALDSLKGAPMDLGYLKKTGQIVGNVRDTQPIEPPRLEPDKPPVEPPAKKTEERMPKCPMCSGNSYAPYKCMRCGRNFCAEHRAPEKHYCDIDEEYGEQDTEKSKNWPEHHEKNQAPPSRDYVGELKDALAKVVGFVLIPFVWLYGALCWLLTTFIFDPLRWFNREVKNFVYHTGRGFHHLLSATWALVKILLFLVVVYFIITHIPSMGTLQGVLNSTQHFSSTQQPSAADCTSLKDFECIPNQKPYLCANNTPKALCQRCGCPRGSICNLDGTCSKKVCSDSTVHGECSQNKPYLCDDGQLTQNSSLCGCPTGYKTSNESCVLIQYCADGTEYDECSKSQPLYCINGTLVMKATSCGCSEKQTMDGENCVALYHNGPVNRQFYYTVGWSVGTVNITLYKGLNDHLSEIPRSYVCNPTCPTTQQIYLGYLDQEDQKTELTKLVNSIKSITSDKNAQARIAISLVQNIPYDYDGFYAKNVEGRYPYEVLYDNKGVCGEKAPLLAFLLRELGFGVALLDYSENHQAVGIKCPTKNALPGTIYCFVESTMPTEIGDNQEYYVGVGRLTSTPTVTVISDGATYGG